MKNRLFPRIAAGLAGTLALGAVAVTGTTTTASAAPGTRSLATVLAQDGTELDRRWRDFDIAEAAILTVLDAKPRSPLKAITQGKTRLTVFVPTDGAFRRLVADLTGNKPKTEKATVNAILEVADVDTIETILLYHVVVGKTLKSPRVLARAERDGHVRTATRASVDLSIDGSTVRLADADTDDADPRAVVELLDINKANRQVGHGINRVLRPIDL